MKRPRSRRLSVLYVAAGDWTEERRNYNQVQRGLFAPPAVDLIVLVPRSSRVSLDLPANVTVRRATLPGRAGFYAAEAWMLLTARLRSIDAVATGNTFEGVPAWLLRHIGNYRWVSDIWDAPHKHLVTYYATAATARQRLRRVASRTKVALFRHTLRTADLVLVSICPESLGSYRLAPDRVRAFQNAIDLADLAPVPDAPRRPNSVCYVSSLFLPDRGLDTLAGAATLLTERGRNVEVSIAGTVANSAREAARSRHFRVLGTLSLAEAHALMARSQVGVLPFHWNEDIAYTQPIKVLEYMALGCVVVASDLPGVREIVRPDVDGLLVEPGNAEALAAALERVLSDGDLSRRLRANAYERVQRFDATAKVSAIFREIERVCAA